jgi:hypothetical protein
LVNTASGTKNVFFENVPDRGEGLSEDKLFPEGQVFLLSGYSPNNSNLEQIKQSGFTALGPVYKGQDDALLEKCKAMKIFCLYGLRPKLKDGSLINKKSFTDRKRKFDWNEICASIVSEVDKVKAQKTICLWYIHPEELRWWRKNEIKYLEEAYNAICKTDPHKRPVWTYFPGHYTSNSLIKLLPYQDIAGKGTYTNYSGMEEQRIWVKWSIEQELEAVKKYPQKNIIPILVPEMFRNPKYPEKIRDYVRHDVYLGLVSGAKGIVVYSLTKRKKFEYHQEYLDAYCEVAMELMKRQKLNRYFLFGKSKNDIKMVTSGPESIELELKNRNKQTYKSVNFANIALGSKRLLIAVNSTSKNIDVKFSGFPDQAIDSIDAFSEEKASDPQNGILKVKLAPLEVKAFIFSKINIK